MGWLLCIVIPGHPYPDTKAPMHSRGHRFRKGVPNFKIEICQKRNRPKLGISLSRSVPGLPDSDRMSDEPPGSAAQEFKACRQGPPLKPPPPPIGGLGIEPSQTETDAPIWPTMQKPAGRPPAKPPPPAPPSGGSSPANHSSADHAASSDALIWPDTAKPAAQGPPPKPVLEAPPNPAAVTNVAEGAQANTQPGADKGSSGPKRPHKPPPPPPPKEPQVTAEVKDQLQKGLPPAPGTLVDDFDGLQENSVLAVSPVLGPAQDLPDLGGNTPEAAMTTEDQVSQEVRKVAEEAREVAEAEEARRKEEEQKRLAESLTQEELEQKRLEMEAAVRRAKAKAAAVEEAEEAARKEEEAKKRAEMEEA
eukprot:2631733-Rhodomonas_salina.1